MKNKWAFLTLAIIILAAITPPECRAGSEYQNTVRCHHLTK